MPSVKDSESSMPEEPSSEPAAKRQTPAKGGKPALAVVTLLDGKTLDVNVERKAKGEKIFDEVCEHLDLLEKDYFGLSFRDKAGRRTWLDLDKRVGKVLKGEPWRLDFEVKFYPKDPAQLQEDFTRYLLCLQVRNDILNGKLPCSFVTHAMLGSYLVQSQLGDYNAEDYPDASYLSGFKFCPEPAPGLEERVMALHKGHKGQTPAEAELHYLENAKKLALYGVDMHPVKDLEGVDLQLGVCSTGILVYQDLLRINRFAWPKILKISYRRNNFYIKIRPGEFEQYEQTVGFKLDSSRAAKNLWKVCVDQHTFFRLMSADATKRPAILFPRLGSLYRWNRKTQVEVMGSTINARNSQNFQRSHSCRPSRSLDTLGQTLDEPALDEGTKRHTMSHAPARPLHASPARLDKKPAGGVAVLPLEPFKKKKADKEREKDNGTNGMSANDLEDDEKENRSNRIDDATTPQKEDSTSDRKKQSPSHGFISIFGSPKDKKEKEKDRDGGEKKDKKKREKEKSREKIAVALEAEPDDQSKSGTPKKESGIHGSLGRLGIGKDKSGRDEEKKSKDKDKDKSKDKDKQKGKDKDSSKEKDGAKDTDSSPEKKSDKLSVFKTDKKDKKKDKKDKDEKNKKEKKEGTLDSSKSGDSSLDRTRTPEKDRSMNETETSPYTKVYEYTADDESSRPKSKVGGFSYESDKASPSLSREQEKSPTSPSRRETGVAFNYAPGEISANKIGDDGSGSKKIFGLFGKKKDEKSDAGKESNKPGEKSKEDAKHASESPSGKSGGLFGSLKLGKHGSPKSDKDKDDTSKSNKDKDDTSKSGKDKDDTSKSGKDKDASAKSSKDKDASLISAKDKDASTKSGKDKDTSKSGKDKDASSKSAKDKDSSSKSGKDKDASSKSGKDKDASSKSGKDKDKDKSSKSGKDSSESGLADSQKSAKDGSKSSKDRLSDVSSDLSPSKTSESKKSKKDDKNLKTKNSSSDFLEAERNSTEVSEEHRGPKIVKTTTKSSITNTGGTLTQNVEEKIEDFDTGEVTHSTHVNTAEGLDESRSPYITATAVTTRTATTLEDVATNAKTSKVEEKTVARSTTTTGLRSEERVVTQEVRATTVVNEPQPKRSLSTSSLSSDDSGTPIDGDSGTYYVDRPQGPIVETETVVYRPIAEGEEDDTVGQQTPLVPTVAQRLDDGTFALPGAVVTSQTITSKTRTVETLTYKTEKDGVVETRVEQKITIQSDGDPIDHDKALAEAIQEATAMNPDMRVEKIEIQQEALP